MILSIIAERMYVHCIPDRFWTYNHQQRNRLIRLMKQFQLQASVEREGNINDDEISAIN